MSGSINECHVDCAERIYLIFIWINNDLDEFKEHQPIVIN